MSAQQKCPISGQEMRSVFSATVLGKYDVTYYYCEESGLLKTEKPHWLEEAYRDAIAETDTGLVHRNISKQKRLEPILERLFHGRGKFLDVGGGYGLLTRLMRDIGFDCYSTDRFCKNLFARRFEPGEGFKATALFAFEVFEHIEDPLQFLTDVFDKYGCRTVIFSTLVYEKEIPGRDWWYYSFEAGQHITFYQPRTLDLLAERLGCRCFALVEDLHVITDRKISGLDRLLLSDRRLFKALSLCTHRKRKNLSKIEEDHLLVKRELSGES
jgi:hypothetical protein